MATPDLPPHDPYAALRYRDFRLLVVGIFLSSLGGQLVSVAIGWHLYTVTHSAFALGLVGLVEVIPVVLCSLPAGYASDHYARKNIALVTRLGLLLCSAALGLLALTSGPIWLLYVCVFGIGATRAFFGPASSTLVAQVIPPEIYPAAVGWTSNAWQLAAALGPAAAGYVIAHSGSVVPVYLLDAAFSLMYVALIAAIRSEQPPKPRGAMTTESLAAGARFVRRSPLLLSAFTLDLFAVLFGGATALLPVYATDILHVGATGFGWLRAAPSIGAALMALLIAHRPPFRKAGWTLLGAVAGFGVATMVFGLSRSFGLSLAMLFALGALDSISVVIRSSLTLMVAPESMLGRVAGVNSIFISASNELGAFESGLLASWLGAVTAVVAGGVGTLVVVAACAVLWPQLRNLGELREAAQPSPDS